MIDIMPYFWFLMWVGLFILAAYILFLLTEFLIRKWRARKVSNGDLRL